MCQPYLERVTSLSDEETQEISRFCRDVEKHFLRLAGPRNVSVDLKYDVLCW